MKFYQEMLLNETSEKPLSLGYAFKTEVPQSSAQELPYYETSELMALLTLEDPVTST